MKYSFHSCPSLNPVIVTRQVTNWKSYPVGSELSDVDGFWGRWQEYAQTGRGGEPNL